LARTMLLELTGKPDGFRVFQSHIYKNDKNITDGGGSYSVKK
jgi:hypothetical protein